jgi:hypothetical protein
VVDEDVQDAASASDSDGVESGRRALLVDAEPLVLKIMGQILERSGTRLFGSRMHPSLRPCFSDLGVEPTR